MWFTSWLRSRKRHELPRRRPAFRPMLEALEGRWLPSTLTVLNNLDSGPGSLRADIAAAKSNDTIVFAPGLTGQTITLTGGELLINKNLTITGPGAGQLAVSGNNASRVFDVNSVTSVTVTLSGMTIQGGGAVGLYGGGIANDGGTLTVSNSEISHNTTAYRGGGISNGGTLTVSNSILSGNSASQGGGIYHDGNAPMTVQYCTLSGNSAVYGGGIDYNAVTYNYPGMVQYCTITDNTASRPGGGSAYAHGGGIANAFGKLTVQNSTLSGNTAPQGGGIYNQASLTVSNSTLSGNSASASGGGIYNQTTLTVSNSTLSGNSALQYGGGIANFGYGTLTVSGSTLSGNSASNEGGGIYNGNGGRLTVLDSIFSNNSPDNIFGYYTDKGGNTFS